MLSLPSDVITLLNSGRFALRYMVRIDLASGSRGVWNGDYDVTVSGVVYEGLSGNLTIEEIPGSHELDADRALVRLTGLASEVHAMMDGNAWHQRPAVLSLAFLNDAGAVIHSIPRFSGFADRAPISDAADATSEIAMEIESNNRGLYRSSQRSRADNDQRRVSGSDGFFKYATASAIDVQIPWGRKGEQYPVRPK
jgi:hypothetical protein